VELFRELLLAVRAQIDWYLERLEARRSQQREVEDIPIS
jgi:lipopolysaccharide biosynthesis regulator YciM